MPRSASDIEAELVLARAARVKLYDAKSFTVDSTSGTRSSLDEINKTISLLEAELAAVSRTRYTRGRVNGW